MLKFIFVTNLCNQFVTSCNKTKLTEFQRNLFVSNKFFICLKVKVKQK